MTDWTELTEDETWKPNPNASGEWEALGEDGGVRRVTVEERRPGVFSCEDPFYDQVPIGWRRVEKE